MSLRRRVSELENKVLTKPKWGSSKIVLEDETEIALYEECERIARNVELNGDLTPNEEYLLDELSHILWFRTVDLFVNVIGRILCGDDDMAYLRFNIDLLHFVQDHQKKRKKVKE